MTFVEILPLAKDVSLTLAPLFASGIAWFGLSTWKRQSRGVASYEVARGILLMSYILADRIKMFRSPLLSLSAEGVKENGQIVEEMKQYDDREERLATDFLNFKTKIQEGKALWGDLVMPDYNIIDMAIRELRAGVWEHFWIKGGHATPGATVDDSPERVTKNNLLIYETGGRDPFSHKVNEAFTRLDKILARKMRR